MHLDWPDAIVLCVLIIAAFVYLGFLREMAQALLKVKQ
jgi:hypothetical protein